eukprot:8368610-Pyramimonas_sp.AAC.1
MTFGEIRPRACAWGMVQRRLGSLLEAALGPLGDRLGACFGLLGGLWGPLGVPFGGVLGPCVGVWGPRARSVK